MIVATSYDGSKPYLVCPKELEIPNIPLYEMFKYKIKVSDAHRAWMKNPEELKHCSTGFDFPSQSGETVQEKVSSLKLLHFYSADE
ncbi:unnamed protein product, partial [Vitis vinifera]